MRPADIAECAATGQTARESLEQCFALSKTCRTILDPEGRVVSMFGVCEGGLVWLLASTRIYSHTREFLRRSREEFRKVLGREPVAWCYSFAQNRVHHRWLEWVGFRRSGRKHYFGTNLFLEYVLHV